MLYPLDVLLVGATGVGKSSTLNALFGKEVAQVGYGVNPETQELTSYRLHDYLRFHDSPGLGDGKEADFSHTKKLSELLLRPVSNHPNNGFIDLVLVILDGGSRDFGTTYKLLEAVILKNIAPERVVIGINQADQAMKGRHWNAQTRTPNAQLQQFLQEKQQSVQTRIKEATGLNIALPSVYSASNAYNLGELMQALVNALPNSRRQIY